MLLELFIGKLILGALAGGAVAAALVAISYAVVENWIEANSLRGDTIILEQVDIANAKKVNIGIFRPSGFLRKEEVASGNISGDKLDSTLANRFNGRKKITYKV